MVGFSSLSHPVFNFKAMVLVYKWASSWDNRKFPKYSDTQKFCCNHSKIWTTCMWLYHRVMSPNDADGMANSVDHDQTCFSAVWSGSTLFAQTCLSENLGKLRYGTYHIGSQWRLTWACASAQSCHSLCCSHPWSMEVDQKSDIKAAHARLKNEFTENEKYMAQMLITFSRSILVTGLKKSKSLCLRQMWDELAGLFIKGKGSETAKCILKWKNV